MRKIGLPFGRNDHQTPMREQMYRKDGRVLICRMLNPSNVSERAVSHQNHDVVSKRSELRLEEAVEATLLGSKTELRERLLYRVLKMIRQRRVA